MNTRIFTISGVLCVLAFVALAALGGNETSPLETLQGRWTIAKTNREGRVFSQVIQIEKDQLTFQIFDADSRTRLASKGSVTASKDGPFHWFKVANIRAGTNLDEMQPTDDSRSFVYTLREGKLILASNFDKERDNERPGVEIYARELAAASSEAKLLGKWKMDVVLDTTTYDYELQFARANDRLEATLVSPRSGDHKFKTVQLNKDELMMEVDRDIQGTQVTLVYQAKLSNDGLAGTVRAKGQEDQLSGTWKASKK